MHLLEFDHAFKSETFYVSKETTAKQRRQPSMSKDSWSEWNL